MFFLRSDKWNVYKHIRVSKGFNYSHSDKALGSEWTLDAETVFLNSGVSVCPRQTCSWPVCCLCSDGRDVSSETERLLKILSMLLYSWEMLLLLSHFICSYRSPSSPEAQALIPTSEISFQIPTREFGFTPPVVHANLGRVKPDTSSSSRPHTRTVTWRKQTLIKV